MKRRDLLHAASLAGLTALSGCAAVDAGRTALDAKAEFEYTPPNPVIGESVVFDGSSSNASEWDWYFDDSHRDSNVDAQGKIVTHTFEKSGAHTATLRALAPLSVTPGPTVEETTQVVYVKKKGATRENTQVDPPLSVSTDRISIQLRTVKTRVELGEPASLQFSAANLDAETNLNIRLVLKLPSGVNIRGTSFVESGVGQYASMFNLAPGESAGITIRLKATRTGRFDIGGVANYAFEDKSEQARQGDTTIIVKED